MLSVTINLAMAPLILENLNFRYKALCLDYCLFKASTINDDIAKNFNPKL